MAQAGSATAEAFQSAADVLDAIARDEKRLERLHRRRAQEARQRLAELRATCAALGIQLVITHSREA